MFSGRLRLLFNGGGASKIAFPGRTREQGAPPEKKIFKRADARKGKKGKEERRVKG